jgi:PAS domain S-box-containing protein
MAALGVEAVTRVESERPSGWYRKLFGMLLNTIPCSVLLADRQLRVIAVNDYFLEKSRRRRAETVNRLLHDVFPDALLEYIDIPRQVERALDSGTALKGQKITYRAPGVPVRFYYYSIVPVSDEDQRGPPEYALVVMEDITEQVRLSGQIQTVERQLANVVEHATDVIVSTDAAMRIITWNAAAERLTGHSAEQTYKRPLLENVAEASTSDFENAVKAMVRSSEPQMIYADIMTSQGCPSSLSWVCSPIRDEQGTLLGMVAVGRDMTGAKQFEAQLSQSQKLAALGVMAGGIAHELRNPLTLCSSGAQFLLEDDISSEFRKECAEQIKSGIDRASLVIENLLRFARPQANGQLGEVDVVDSLRNALSLVANVAALQRVEVVAELPAFPVTVVGSTGPIEQVFVNLLINAIDSMPDGGRLLVSLAISGGEVQVSVTDTGCGISGSEINKIFDPFYSGFRHKNGTGLGLAISYSIIKQHQGDIQVSSAEGKGSTFIVVLPSG